MEWFFTGPGGIKQAENSVAFKNIIIRPEIVGDLTHVKSSYWSPYGMIRSEWKTANKILEMNVVIPANTTATIYLPTNNIESVTDRGRKVTVSKTADGKYCCKVGSGLYDYRMAYSGN